MVGVGGGAGVLGTDDWDDHGFVLPSLPEPIRRHGGQPSQRRRDHSDQSGGHPFLGFGQEPFMKALASFTRSKGSISWSFTLP